MLNMKFYSTLNSRRGVGVAVTTHNHIVHRWP